MEAIVCGNFLKTTERAHASTKLTLRPGSSWSDIEFSENPNEAGKGCLDRSFRNDYLHLSRKAEMAQLFPPGVGLPHVLCGTVPDGSKGCSQICPLTSRWDWAAVRPLFLRRPSCREYLLVPWVLQFRTQLVWSHLSVGIWCGRNRVRDLLRR